MANLSESPDWVAGIYQFEESDPVQGGAEGIDNLQAKQLANRTGYLKLLVEAAQNNMTDHLAAADPHAQYATELWVAAQIASLLDSAPGALDTLNELAAAMGDDANFAATMTNALALKAPLISPLFTGDPAAPTPAQFDNDTSLATTAFVQRALGNARAARQLGVDEVLTVADAGSVLLGAIGSSAVTLPASASLPDGASLYISSGAATMSVLTQGADQIMPYLGINPTGVASYPLGVCQSIHLVKKGAAFYVITSTGSASLAASGYQKLPSGLISQWGTFNSGSVGINTFVLTPITLPIAFPNAHLTSFATINSAALAHAQARTNGLSGLNICSSNHYTSSQALSGYYGAIGF